MTFDPTITLSGALIFLSNVVIALVYLMRMEGKLNVVTDRIENQTKRIDGLETTVATLIKTDVRLATLEERLTNHVTMITTAQRDISDLRRGNGFITHPRERVDGEYP